MNDRSRSGGSLRARYRALAAEAILDAAEAVFTEHGLQAGMDAIAARAGVAVGTLYNHFGDRDRLVLALMQARTEQALAAMDAALQASADAPFRAQLTAAIGALAEAMAAHAAFRRLVVQADVQRPAAEKLAVGQLLASRLGAVLARGEAEGAIGPDPLGLRPILLLGLLHAAFTIYLHTPERLAATQIAEVVTAQFIDGARGGGR